MYQTTILQGERPRNVNAFQAAAILYGDWGTSKAYVLGLAFALAGYSSFWLIAGVSLLNIVLGLNYMTICKYYPNGGGVYASVRKRSEILALVGGFFIIADYIVTASLSALSAFQYLGVSSPDKWAICIIAFIGALNYLGPRHTGSLALAIAVPTVVVVFILGVLSFFHLSEAVATVQPLHGGLRTNWTDFVGVIVALSGIEAIANSTGVMRLDPGSTNSKPSVIRTATPAIAFVMLEVWFFTTLFGLAMNALPGLTTDGINVNAPDYPNVRDSMLRYMGQIFASNLVGPYLGQIFGYVVSIVFCILLLSAVNTAIVALISLIFVMSRDGELPKIFQKLNRFGVPKFPLLIATVAPMTVLYFVDNIAGLANLYAVGFVGAIATNLGSTSTDKTLDLKQSERVLMFGSFLLMAAIEITLFIDKPEARTFVITILAIGLILRGLVMEQKKRLLPAKDVRPLPTVAELTKEVMSKDKDVLKSGVVIESAEGKQAPKIFARHEEKSADMVHMHNGAMLCAVTHPGKALEFAIEECGRYQQQLYVLFIREQKIIVQDDQAYSWLDDKEACQIFDFTTKVIKDLPIKFLYAVSASPAYNIVKIAGELKISRVILGMPRRGPLLQIIRGDIVRDVREFLPDNIDLVVVS